MTLSRWTILFSLFLWWSVGPAAMTGSGPAQTDKRVACRIDLDRAVLPAGENLQAIVKITLEAPAPPENLARPPVNLAIVLDSSSSMSGQKIQKAKEAAIEALRRLGRQDLFSLVTYSDRVDTLLPAQSMRDLEKVERQIRAIRAGGNTALFGGVSQGAAEVRKHLNQNYIHRILLLSDGLANIGPSSPEDLGRLGAAMLKEQISVTTVGVGDDYNEDLMTRLSQMSDGNTYYVHSGEDLPGIFTKELGEVLSVVAKKVKLTVECPEGVRPVALIGREGIIRGQTVTLLLNQLYGNQEKYALLEVEIEKGLPDQNQALAKAEVSYEDVFTNQRVSGSASAQARFTKNREEIMASINKDVQQAYHLNDNAISQDRAIALADKGNIKEAVQELKQSSDNLKTVGRVNEDPVLLKKARDMDALAQEIEKEGISKKNRKQLRTDSYQMRNQQSTPVKKKKPVKKKEKDN